MLTQDQKQERNRTLSRINYGGKIDVNAPLIRRLEQINEQALRKQGRATFGPIDEGSSIFWDR